MSKTEETREMAALYERGGMTMQQIGERYGVSRQTVSQRLAKLEITRPALAERRANRQIPSRMFIYDEAPANPQNRRDTECSR